MGNFKITGPDGKQYKVAGDNAEGAYAALKKMLSSDASPQGVPETPDGSFGEQNLAVPAPPDAPVEAPKPTLPATPAPAPEEAVGPVPGVVDPVARAKAAAALDPKAAPLERAPQLPVDPMMGAMTGVIPSRYIGDRAIAGGSDDHRKALETRLSDPNLTPETREVLQRQLDFMTDTRNKPDPHAARAEEGPDPFYGEDLGPLLKRRGQQFARGATEIFASMPETAAIAGAVRDQSMKTGAAETQADRQLIIDDMTEKLKDPNLAPETRAFIEQNLADYTAGQAVLAEEAAKDVVPAKDRPVFKYGDKVREGSAAIFGKPDPRDTSFWGQVAEGGGSVAGFASSALVPGGAIAKTATGAALGAEANSSSMYREAIEAGATEEVAQKSAKWGALIGSAEIVPINRALKILPRSWGPKVASAFNERLVSIAESSGEEAAQEYLSQVANNITAQQLYDPERGWTEGATEQAIIGAILGGGLDAAAGMVTGGERKTKPGPVPGSRGPAGAPTDPMAAAMTGQKPKEPPLTLTANMRSDVPPVVPKPDPKAKAEAALRKFAAATKDAAIPADSPASRQMDSIIAEAERAGMTSDEIDEALSGREPAKSETPSKPDIKAEADAAPAGEFEVMEEVETVDGVERPTGRKVRVNMNTGESELVDDETPVSNGSEDGSGGATEEPQAAPDSGPAPSAEPEPIASAKSEPKAEAETASDPEFTAGRKAPVRKFLTHEETLAIKTNPKAFQYKGGGDAEGVTDALRNITSFDPNRAGQVVLFERKDGTMEVADGHQRTGLARRAAANGQADVGGTAATVYREADGYTADEVMGLAALKNIGEGSGTAIDAARILRTRSESIGELGLPPNSALVRKAEGLRRLGQDAFGMVANGVASEEHGDIVGRNVPNEALQPDILALLTRLKPDNMAQAAMIARDAAADSTTETQTDMFGDLQVSKSLYVERAKILDTALKSQVLQQKTFKALIDKKGTITAAGNTLDDKANAALVDDAAKVRQYLTSQANMKGPISDALTKAAEAVRSGSPVSRAAEGFVLDVKRALEGGGEGSQAPAPGRAGDESRPANESSTVEPAPAPEPGADLFGAMTGQPTPKTDASTAPTPEADLFAAMTPPPKGKTPDQVRAEAEAKVKGDQSKIRTAKPQGDAGPLFGDQAELPVDAPAPAPKADPIEAGRAVLKAYEKPDDAKFDKHAGRDLRDERSAKALAKAIGNAKTAKEREDLADAFILKRGKETGVEILVMLDADGAVLAIMEGLKGSVSMHAAVWRAMADGKVAYATHNHPSSADFSANDISLLAIGIKKIVAMAHNGLRHEATAVPGAIPALKYGYDDPRWIRELSNLQKALDDTRTPALTAVNNATWRLPTYDPTKKGVPPEFDIAAKMFPSLVLDRLGVINYSGGTVEMIEAQGYNFGELYGSVSGPIRDRLGPAGFNLTEKRDQGGNLAPESEPEAISPPDRKADQPDAVVSGQSDGAGGLRPETDFDAAASSVLDDLFGPATAKAETPAAKPAKRTDADIAKDLGGLFNEDPAQYQSPMERAKAKARSRPKQRDMFDLLNAAQPGERQTDLEDLLEDIKDRGRDLFGFGEDIISQDTYAKAVPLFRETLAGQDVTAQPVADTIRAVAIRLRDTGGMTREGIERMLPYLKLYLQDVASGKLTNPVEEGNAPAADGDLERDSGDAKPGDGVGQVDLPPAGGRPRSGDSGRGAAVRGGSRGQPGGARLSGSDAAPVGTQGNPEVQGGVRGEPGPAVDRDGLGGRDRGEQRPRPDEGSADLFGSYARPTTKPSLAERAQQQADADRLTKAQGVKWGDEASIRQSLPLLLPEQQDDVIKIETRFAKPNGHGMLITNGTGTGKAQPLDAGILTPSGWRKMGDIAVGDLVISAEGKPIAVTGIHPQGLKPIYRVEFSDGAVTECCDEHLWETQTLYERRKARTNPDWNCAKPKVRALADIRASLDAQHFVPVALAIDHPARTLPVQPYVLGVILGDGSITQNAITFSSADQDIADAMAGDLDGEFMVRRTNEPRCPTWRISDPKTTRDQGRFGKHRMTAALRDMGLMGAKSADKFIPADYLTASVAQRTLLLQGLMDTDGTVDRRTGSVSFCTVSACLADGVIALVRSLGGTCGRSLSRKFYSHDGARTEGQTAHVVTLHLPNEVALFRLSRKAALVRAKDHAPRRKIVAVSLVGTKLAQCIAVDHPRHLYVTDDYLLTHNTYSGGGQIKRFVQAGKTNILIAAPSQGILDHWKEALADMGVETHVLTSTKDAGKGVTLTTYANMGENDTLSDREWDLVVTDEAHKLSQNAQGDSTAALDTLRAITNRPANLVSKARMKRRREWAKAEAMPKGDAKTGELNRLAALAKQEADAMRTLPRGKVLFLSATPFAYVKNTDYAEGYLFDYPKDGHVGHSRQSGQALFMVENFGYRIRYHKLTKPDVGVDTGVFEREFHEKMRRDGVLSGRMLDIAPDYDRHFVMTENAQGRQIDDILQFISDQTRAKGDSPTKQAYQALQNSMKDTFNYLRQMQLLEAIKADLAIPDIEAHLKLGRKVVLFHDYNVGGGFNPFRPVTDIDKGIYPGPLAIAGYEQLLRDRPEVEDLNFSGLLPPVQALTNHFGKRAHLYNGTIPQKDRAATKAKFNTDGSGVDLIIVQSAAGEAGISLHDTTGGHQRVLINLGMPTRPTTALQEEGRIRREGSVSDAPFRYYTIGTAWERRAFAKKIAERSGTVENLALGDQARTIKLSFIDAYENAAPIKPHKDEGKGGKEKDRAQARTSPYDAAKTHYYGRMKTTGKRDQRDGLDFYPTPEPVAFKMVEWAGVRAYESVLEPSAGDGSIARYFPEHARRTIVEPSTDLLSRAELKASGSTAVNKTFEDYHIVNKHHAIVMNPPFGSGGKTAMDHLAKAMLHLKPGGRIVALVPTGPAADKRFEALWDSEASDGFTLRATVYLPAVAFEKAGTAVMSRILVIDKTGGERNYTGYQHLDYTDITEIGKLFDKLEDRTLPERVPTTTDALDDIEDAVEVDEDGDPVATPIIQMTPAPVRMAPALAGGVPTFKLSTVKHGKTGADQFVAAMAQRLPTEDYQAALAIAKKHGGWYSMFRGNGAVPGFQFKTEAQRQAFLDDIAKPVQGLREDPAPYQEPLYSPLLKAVRGAKQQKASPGDWRAILPKLPGVKKTELEWVGVEQYLATMEAHGVKQVEKADLARFIDESRLRIVVDVLGDVPLEPFQPRDPIPLMDWIEPTLEDAGNRLIDEDSDQWDTPSYAITDGTPIYPDDYTEEAELYLDEARQELADEREQDWDEEAEGREFDPETDISDDDVLELAKDMAEKKYEATEYDVTLYDTKGGQPEVEGYWNSDSRTYTFPDLDLYDVDSDEVMDAARSAFDAKFEAAAQERLNAMIAEGRDALGNTRAEWQAARDEAQARYEVEMARWDQKMAERQAIIDADGLTGPSKWGGYREKGGATYQEILIRVPDLDRLDEKRAGGTKAPFVQSSHFSQKNIVVHARTTERTDTQGRKVLFVEEIQSDLASAWRKVTVDSPEKAAKRAELQAELAEANAAEQAAMTAASEELPKMHPTVFWWEAGSARKLETNAMGKFELARALKGAARWSADGKASIDKEKPQSLGEVFVALHDADPGVARLARRLTEAQDRSQALNGQLLALGTERKADPSLTASPWSDPEQYVLMVKQLLQRAAAKGFDKLAWTPGWMQARRWGKAAQSVVDAVVWGAEPADVYPVPAVRVNMAMSGGRNVNFVADRASGEILTSSGGDSAMLEGKTLRQLLGPSVAKQIAEQDSGDIAGEKITLAESGYAIAYDGHIKRAIEKLVRPFGGAVVQDKTILQAQGATASLNSAALREGRDRLIERVLNAGMRAPSWQSYVRNMSANAIISNELHIDELRQLYPDADAMESVWSVELSPEIQDFAKAPMAMFKRAEFPDVDQAAEELADRDTMKHMLAMMPALRKELDRLDLKRVKLYYDPLAEFHGKISGDENGNFTILIGSASQDAMATLHHEVIHALYHSNLFTPQEWATLKRAAMNGGWMRKWDINRRYPNLTYDERLEEAIAEEFGEAYAKRTPPPKDPVIITAFNKIVRFFRAIRNAMTSQRNSLRPRLRETSDDVFARVLSGQIGKRYRGFEGYPGVDGKPRYKKARLPGKQARAHMATPMGGNHLHIPDRGIWDELTKANATVWERLRGGRGAARDAVDRARIKIQDRMLPILRAQDEIEKRRGAPLPSNMDVYAVETTFSGKVGKHLFDIDEDYTKPIIDLIAKTQGRLTSENVGEWLYARHAEERNQHIASINLGMPDGGSGMMTADARAILAQAAASQDAQTLNRIGALIDALRERTLQLRQSRGLITQAEANRWRSLFKNYVPMKGFADNDHTDAMLDVSGVGRRYSTRGPESRRALGRKTEAFNPLQAAITQAQEVAIRAEKNAVGVAALELVRAHPSPALWSVKKVKMKQVFNRTTGLVELRPEDPKTMFLEPNEMAVKEQGIEYRLMFHDARIAGALGQVGADRMNGILRALSLFSRFFSMTRTMLNPEFVLTNAFRDFQTAQMGIQNFGRNPKTGQDDRNAIALAMTKNWRKAMAGVFRGLGGQKNTTWSQHYEDFTKAGAHISFWTLDQPEAAVVDLEKRIDLARGTKAARILKHMVRPSAVFNMRDNPVLSFIERTNLAVDNAIRLAAFVKARELGWDVQDAAFLAKELTVNFNRRGEGTSGINALYPFFNAAIQGTVRLGKALTGKRVATLALLSVAAGVVLDLANAGLSDRDDDDELFYDKIPEYRSERNLHLVLWGTGDNALSIPMPYGYNIFPYAGQQIGKVMRGVKTPTEAFGDLSAAAFGAFSPINGGSPATTVAPAIADPFIELAENSNFAGNTIYPAYPAEGLPDSQVFYPSATLLSRHVAETLNAMSGGDFRQSGYIDVSPESLDHLAAYVGGSASAFWGRSTDIIGKVMTGKTDEIEQRNVPFVRILTSPVGEFVNRDRYRKHSLAVRDAAADAKAYKAAGVPVPPEVAAKAALYEELLAAERELDGKGDWNPTKEGALTPREDQAIWLDFSKKYLKATRP